MVLRPPSKWLRAAELPRAVPGERLDDPEVVACSKAIAQPLPVPATAIWSASDGLVQGLICRCDDADAIEVRSGHLGVQLRPEVLVAVVRVLRETILPRQGEDQQRQSASRPAT